MNNQSGSKCDVWSLGVLLWETVTLGGTPYSTVATKEVAMRVARGMRLPRVPGLSDQLYQVMHIRMESDCNVTCVIGEYMLTYPLCSSC